MYLYKYRSTSRQKSIRQTTMEIENNSLFSHRLSLAIFDSFLRLTFTKCHLKFSFEKQKQQWFLVTFFVFFFCFLRLGRTLHTLYSVCLWTKRTTLYPIDTHTHTHQCWYMVYDFVFFWQCFVYDMRYDIVKKEASAPGWCNISFRLAEKTPMHVVVYSISFSILTCVSACPCVCVCVFEWKWAGNKRKQQFASIYIYWCGN